MSTFPHRRQFLALAAQQAARGNLAPAVAAATPSRSTPMDPHDIAAALAHGAAHARPETSSGPPTVPAAKVARPRNAAAVRFLTRAKPAARTPAPEVRAPGATRTASVAETARLAMQVQDAPLAWETTPAPGAKAATRHQAEPAAPIRFFVHGTPVAQPRARACRRGRRAGVYDPGTADEWKQDVARAAGPYLPAQPLEGPLRVDLTFYVRRPKALMRKKDPAGPMWCPVKPDRDNLDKAVLDCLTDAGLWNDDAQVCDGVPRKLYAGKDGRTGCLVVVTPLAGEPETDGAA